MVLTVLVGTMTAQAQIRITKQAGDKISIQMTGLNVPAQESARIFQQVLQADLSKSGWFVIGRPGQSEVNITGSVTLRGAELNVECRVLGATVTQQYLAKSYRHDAADARRLAHRVADDIVEAVTGRKGIASTRIVLVGIAGQAKELFLCDADGGNLRQLTQDRSVVVRPRWGPKGEKITYTSYLRRFPDVYLADLVTGARTLVANYSGLNAGGVISPDERDLAVVLSKDGNPELYVKNLQSGRLTRLTQTPQAAEASPSWSPDGQQIVYVSDQAGRPHLYIISRNGGAPRRITSRGTENVAPDWGPNGLIAFTCREGGRYQIGILDPRTDQLRFIEHPDYADYEDASWAPDGRHLVVSRKENYRSTLYMIDTMGDPPIRLIHQAGDWYSPAWSPR